MTVDHDEPPPIRPRHPRFDFGATPVHWVPGDAFTSHVINVLSLIAPPAERQFVRVCRQVLPLVGDSRLSANLRGFMGQEAAHAVTHDAFLAALKERGIDAADFVARFDGAYEWLAGEHPPLPVPEPLWLQWRVAVMVAGEQITHVLGDWVLDARALDEAGADATVLEFLRWHGAEEVEHRAVAFDLACHLYGPAEYPLRVAAMAVAFPFLLAMWHHGTDCFFDRDPGATRPPSLLLAFIERAAAGRVPGWTLPLAALRFLDPGFHPGRACSSAKAEAHFANSLTFSPAAP